MAVRWRNCVNLITLWCVLLNLNEISGVRVQNPPRRVKGELLKKNCNKNDNNCVNFGKIVLNNYCGGLEKTKETIFKFSYITQCFLCFNVFFCDKNIKNVNHVYCLFGRV